MREKLNAAISFAAQMHKDQIRKGTGAPYILHPMEVAAIIGSITNDEDVLIAGLLHDVVEDTPATSEDVEKAFGKRVAELVASETENKRPGLPKGETWRIRKEESLEELKKAEDEGVYVLWLGDKLSNLRSFWQMYRTEGDKMFELFHEKDKAMHAWYYASIRDALRPTLEKTAAFEELCDLIGKIFSV